MQMLILAYETSEDFALRDNKAKFESYMGAWYAYSEEMSKAGVTQSGAALEPPSTATTVSVRDGKRLVQDGPYPEGKEQLGGFFLIDADDIDAGAEWAAKCPAAKTGFVDIRVIADHKGSES